MSKILTIHLLIALIFACEPEEVFLDGNCLPKCPERYFEYEDEDGKYCK